MAGRIRWRSTEPLLEAPEGCDSIKDPSIIRFGGAWHLFATVRAPRPTHRLAYVRLDDELTPNRPTFLRFGTDMVAAPQVFLHRRDGRFFLIFQAAGPFTYGPAYSTNETLDPATWSNARPLYRTKPEGVVRWLDFWVIGDGERTFLFFTSLDGKMWRSETTTDRFPEGFSPPVVALDADIFEAAHVYRLCDRFFCVVEAKRLGRRYQRLFVADALAGRWKPAGLFATAEGIGWSDSVSHGELIRARANEEMEIRPGRLRYLFQGARDVQVIGRKYGRIPWRLAMLESLEPVAVDQIFDARR